MSTYISNGNYMYGISEYDQPCVPYYNDTIYHKKPDIREFPCKKIKDDGYPYIAQLAYPNCCATCNKCNAVNRNTIINNFINIETYIDRILTITLYATTKDKDEIVKMKIGNKYCITYLTENGLQTVTGVFKEVSENVPDECLRYIGNFNSVTSAAYICLDCSSVGSSDKRLIYIASIRYIKEIFDENDDPYNNLTQEEKIIKAYSDIQTTISSINKYIEDNTKSDEEENNEEENNEETNNTTTQQNNTPQIPPSHPNYPPYQGPIIIGARPPFPPPPPPYSYNYQDNNNASSNNNDTELLNEDVLTMLTNIKDMLNSFITTYINNKDTNEECNCNCHNNNDTSSSNTSENNNNDTNNTNTSEDNNDDTNNTNTSEDNNDDTNNTNTSEDNNDDTSSNGG